MLEQATIFQGQIADLKAQQVKQLTLPAASTAVPPSTASTVSACFLEWNSTLPVLDCAVVDTGWTTVTSAVVGSNVLMVFGAASCVVGLRSTDGGDRIHSRSASCVHRANSRFACAYITSTIGSPVHVRRDAFVDIVFAGLRNIIRVHRAILRPMPESRGRAF